MREGKKGERKARRKRSKNNAKELRRAKMLEAGDEEGKRERRSWIGEMGNGETWAKKLR